MGNFYVLNLDPSVPGPVESPTYGEMYGPTFELVEAMRKLRDRLLERLEEFPLFFEHHYRQGTFPPVTVRWEALRHDTGVVTVGYQGRVVTEMLLLPGLNRTGEEQAFEAFLSRIRMRLQGQAAAQLEADPGLLTRRPLVVRVAWERKVAQEMPLDLPEWCLAAAFFHQKGAI